MKILMALAGLEIGGAETHVVELSKELKRRGHDVSIISGGGVYADEVENFGIRHYTVPVGRRNITDMVKSAFIINKIIKTEKPDIVHSHARIPSFIIGEIHRLSGKSFVYVTTVHAQFDTSPLVKKLSRWGEKTLAVSHDLAEYLHANYAVSKKVIYNGINGIDTHKFNENIPKDKIVEEFSLNPDAKRIVYVSRLEKDVYAPAMCILEKMRELNEKFPLLEFVIVGGGDGEDEIRRKADEVNKLLSRKAVILTGKRTDVNEIHASADVCVGVSRAILEPMAMKKPCIIAGQEGYIGILSEENISLAIETNFTARGCKRTDADVLFGDLCTLLSMDEKAISKVAQLGKNVTDEHYSVAKMAKDNEKMYKDAIRDHKPNTIMMGYYGYGNRGDDALLWAVIDEMRKKSPEFCPAVLSKNPDETYASYGVHAVNRFNFFKIRKLMKSSKLLIAGGGSLIQDVTSTRSLMYYLYCLSLAKKSGLKVMLYANGIGPIRKPKNKKKSAKILDSLDVITLRDSFSADFLRKMNVTKPLIKVTGDAAFSLGVSDTKKAEKVLEEMGLSENLLVISVRNTAEEDSVFAQKFAHTADRICQKHNLVPVLIPMQYTKDKKISLDIVSRMETKAFFIDRDLEVETIMGIVSKAKATFAVRLHMLLFALVMGVPVIGINYDPKVKSNIEELGSGICLETEELGTDAGYEKACTVFENMEEIRNEIPLKISRLREKAGENADIASNLLK